MPETIDPNKADAVLGQGDTTTACVDWLAAFTQRIPVRVLAGLTMA